MVTPQRIAQINELMATTGLSVVWDDEYSAFIFRLSDTDKETVDQWWNIIQMLSMDWDESQPFNSIYEFTDSAGLMSNYARQMVTLVANEIDNIYPRLHGRLAIVIPPTAQARFLRVFVQTIIYYGPSKFEFQIFNNAEAAGRWLKAAAA